VDFWGEIIHFYLTGQKQFAVLPQAAILRDVNGHPCEAYLDFMALDIKKSIYLVEISGSTTYPVKIGERLEE
jgi:hypothetical protein